MGRSRDVAHDPSARDYAGTSPRFAQGGKKKNQAARRGAPCGGSVRTKLGRSA